MATLYGLSPADVSQDVSGNIQAGKSAVVYTSFAGGSIYTQTYSVGSVLEQGASTGGVVITDAKGRIAFYADTTQPLWLDWGDGTRWPVNPLDLDALVASKVDPVRDEFIGDVDTLVDERLPGLRESALGEIAITVVAYATAGQIAGTEDATSAWQAAGDALVAKGGGKLVGTGGQWWFDGTGMVDVTAWNDTTVDLAGSRIFKTSTSGNYVVFLDRYGALGYGGGVNHLTIENGLIEGSFSDASPAPVNLFCGNHSRHVTIRNCVFRAVAIQGNHTFELDGCDSVLIDNCVWYGYKPDGINAPRTEAINTDSSVVGSGAAVAGYADGLPCKNITVRNCRFLPWMDPATSITYPAPIPLGTHSPAEYGRPENIKALDILVVDPPVDNADTGVAGDDSYLRGLIHYPAVKGLTVRMRVVATSGTGSIRCVHVQSSSTGVLASSDPNAPASGAYAAPLIAEDIDIDLSVEGLNGTGTTLNPAVFVGGVSGVANGLAQGVRIRGRFKGIYKEAVYLRAVTRAAVDFTTCSNATSGVRAAGCTGVTVRGNFKDVQIPARALLSSTKVAVGPVTAENATLQPYLFEVDSTSDRVVASGVVASGYTALYSRTTITNHAESGVLVGA